VARLEQPGVIWHRPPAASITASRAVLYWRLAYGSRVTVRLSGCVVDRV
jgi:hypothetical protein